MGPYPSTVGPGECDFIFSPHGGGVCTCRYRSTAGPGEGDFFAVILVALPVIVQHEEIGLRLKQAMGGLLKFVLDKFAL